MSAAVREHILKQAESSEGCDYDQDELDPESNLFPNINDICNYYTDTEFTKIETAGSFSLIHLNCRSLYSNFSSIYDYLNTLQNKFTVIAMSETWLTEEKGVEFHFEGYDFFYVNRTNRRGGGVALYVSSDLKCKTIESMTNATEDLMECLTIEIEMKKQRNIVVTCIYRTPGSSITTFNNKLEQLLFGINENKVSIICGDFNINLLNVSNHTGSLEFLDLMYSRGLYPTITRPSRITSSCATLIDNIFLNIIDKNVKSGLLINDTTDHLPIFVTYLCEIKTNKDKSSKVIRLRTEERLNRFKDALMKEQWDNVYSTNNVNKAYELFVEKYLWLYNKNCPIKTMNNRARNNKKPWLTKGISKACKKKNKLYRDFVKYRTANAEKKYKAYKNKLTSIMRRAKKDYYTNLLIDNKSNIKRMWKVLREVMGSEVNCCQPLYLTNEQNLEISGGKMADEFNSFFCNVGPNLAKTIPLHNENKSWTGESRVIKSLFLDEVGENEIISTVSKLKSKYSCDSDGLDMYIVKETISCISRPLKYIINLSFNLGFFPEKMKVAKIIPLFKSGDRHSLTNYRPISLLSQFSKIIEKLFVKKFDCFLEKNSLIHDNQFGFRSTRSTSMALMKITEDITTELEKKNHTIGVFIDLKKAFDTLDHGILISKLQTYGIRGVVLNWIISYLENRQQYVEYLGHESKLELIQCGVPQGSVLGPKLFSLYINDLCEESKILRFVLFADDTNFFASGKNLNVLVKTIEQELVLLQKWFNKNRLSLNLSKTKFMLFTNQKCFDNVSLSFNGIIIERVSEFRFLGVLIDEKLKWKSHIAYVRNKICRNIAVMSKVKFMLNCKAMRILYCSFILPYLMYCLEIWGNSYFTNLAPLFILQKRALRIIHGVAPREHTTGLFLESGLLKLKDLVSLQTLLVVHKAKHCLLPCGLQTLFTLNSETSRRNNDFKQPFAGNTLKQMCVSVSGVKRWNLLENDLKCCSNILQFKNNYKQKILKVYKEECEN